MFDFPASPTTGQTFQPAGGPLYQFNGYAWVSAPVASGFMALKRTVVTALGTTTAFQFDTKTQFAEIEVVGGGGGGGSTAGSAAVGSSAAGGGGGSGGYTKKLVTVDATVRAATKTINVGAAGTAATAAAGGPGGQSSYGDTVNALVAGGGGGGAAGGVYSGCTQRNGGGGGSASGGDVNVVGSVGGGGIAMGSVQMGASLSMATAGTGAAGPLGGGSGLGGSSGGTTGSNASGLGSAGTAYGAGGGGSEMCNAIAHAASGAGYQGVVIITEYFAAQAPAGIAIDEAPSDGNEYVRVNGVWRLKHQSFSPGTNGVNIPVPATAKHAKITGRLIGATAGLIPVIRCSVDGSTFYSGSTDYTHGGTILYSGSTASPQKVAGANAAYMYLGMGSYTDSVIIPLYLDVDLVVGKTAPMVFGFRSRQAAYHSAATAGFQEALAHGYGSWAGQTSQTQLAAFQIINAGGTFAPSPASVIDVEWVY